MRIHEAPSSLARYLFAAYALLIVYASLHPFSGWADNGAGPLAWLVMARPKYITVFDVTANVLAYVPLGFLGVLSLFPVLRGGVAALISFGLGVLLSAILESLQTYLPSRYASNVDLAANAAGALIGVAIGLATVRRLLRDEGLHALRHRVFRPGAGIDFGLVLLGLWLFSLLNPETLLFGNGDFLLQLEPGVTLGHHRWLASGAAQALLDEEAFEYQVAHHSVFPLPRLQACSCAKLGTLSGLSGTDGILWSLGLDARAKTVAA